MEFTHDGMLWTDRTQSRRRSILTCSRDAIDIDFEIDIYTKNEPGYWLCYNIAQRHGCDFFTLTNIYGDILM